MDASTVNWSTVVISWAISTVTTILLLFISCLINAKCKCCSGRKQSPNRNQHKHQNATDCLDLIEWNSNKPLQTSSPLLQRHDIKSAKCDVDANNNAKITNEAFSSKTKSTQPPLLGNSSKQIILSSSATQDKQRQINKGGNVQVLRGPLVVKSSSSTPDNTDRRLTSDRDLFTNKQSFLTNTSMTRNNNDDSRLNSALNPLIKIKTKSSITVMNAESKRDSALTTGFIRDLKESPTEKKRQSIEKLRRSKVTVDKSEDENNDENEDRVVMPVSNPNSVQVKTDKNSPTNKNILKFQPVDISQVKNTTTDVHSQRFNSTTQQGKKAPNSVDVPNSKLPPRPIRSNCSSHGNITRDPSKFVSATSSRRHTTYSSTPVLMQMTTCSGAKMNCSNDSDSIKVTKPPNKISLIDFKSLSCEAFPLNLQQRKSTNNNIKYVIKRS